MRPPIWDLFLSISCTFYLKTGCVPPHLRQNSAPPFGKSWICHCYHGHICHDLFNASTSLYGKSLIKCNILLQTQTFVINLRKLCYKILKILWGKWRTYFICPFGLLGKYSRKADHVKGTNWCHLSGLQSW